MADIKQIQIALKNLCVNAVYPNGISQPSVANTKVIFRIGRPNPVSLDQELADSQARVNIYTDMRERNVTRFPFNDWEVVQQDEATISAVINNKTITFTGSPTIGQTVVVIVNKNSANPYTYTIQSGDTLNTIAAALAFLIPSATANNNTITVDNAYHLSVRVSTRGIAIRELKRQQRVIRICIKANSGDIRDIIASAIDTNLAKLPSFDLNYTINLNGETFTIADYSVRLIYQGSPINDQAIKANLLQRDLLMQVEYATIEAQIFYSIADAYNNVTRTSNPHLP